MDALEKLEKIRIQLNNLKTHYEDLWILADHSLMALEDAEVRPDLTENLHKFIDINDHEPEVMCANLESTH